MNQPQTSREKKNRWLVKKKKASHPSSRHSVPPSRCSESLPSNLIFNTLHVEMSYSGGSEWNSDHSGRQGGPPQGQYGNSRGPQQHYGGGQGNQRRHHNNNNHNNRSGPTNRGYNNNHRGGGHSGSHHRPQYEQGGDRYIKASFLENPWRYLEIKEGIPSEQPAQTSAPQYVPKPVQQEPTAPQPTEEPEIQTSTRIGLSLPPPKQTATTSAPKKSSFLSMLPPPKQSDNSDDLPLGDL